MKEIESYKSYWNEFLEKDLDPTKFKSLVSKDAILSKIYNFAFNPWSISESIHEYPFDSKTSELKSISEEEEDYLFDKRLYQKGDLREWFNFLCKRYLLVKHTIKIKSELDRSIKQASEKISKKTIREFVKLAFDNHLSQDFTTTYKKTGGIQIIKRTTGLFYPVRVIKDFVITTERKILNDETGGHEKFKTKKYLRQEYYLKKTTGKDIETAFNELDVFSVECFQKHGQIMPNITYGGLHPSLDGSSYQKTLGYIPPEFEQFLIEFYYIDPKEKDKNKKFKPLTYRSKNGKKYTQFVFPIRKRFRPLMVAVVKKTLKKYHELLGDEGSLLREAEGKLLETVKKYDPSKGVRPAGFIFSKLKHFQSEVYESQSTTALPGDPRKKGKLPYCDSDCKEEKHKDKFPCEFETPEGYCKDPRYVKNKRELKTVIEHSGPLFDDTVYDENNEEVRRIDNWNPLVGSSYLVENDNTKVVDIDLLKEMIVEKLNQNEKDLFYEYYDKSYTQKEIANNLGIAQSSVSTKISNLKKKIFKIINELRL